MDLCGFISGSRLVVRDHGGQHRLCSRRQRPARIFMSAEGAVVSGTETIESRIAAAKKAKDSGEERVRFAPSPTGALHIGGARTALYNWLHAKNKSGKVILRVEDTDQARSTRESEREVLRDLSWLGINFDEGPDQGGELGPYRQSERNEVYVELGKRLLQTGHAYPCFCTEEELEMKRKQAEAEGRPPHYDGTWRDADPDEVKRRMDNGEPYTVRFRIPDENAIVTIEDVVRGKVEWDAHATVGDFIVLRSNGIPVYNFCVAVDDALMGITTVIRAEEHLTNSLRQILVLKALGFDVPKYAHCALILGSDRSKLSKRHGATSCDQFRKEGYLPVAMVNYLALLGWNNGTTKELYWSREEVAEDFDLNRVGPSPTMFDASKLIWINGQHLRAMEIEDLAPLVRDHLVEKGLLSPDTEASSPLVTFITKMFQGSMNVVNDVSDELEKVLAYSLRETIANGETEGLLEEGGGFKELAAHILAAYDAGELPDGTGDEHAAVFKTWVKATGKATKRKGKGLFHPVRLALTGQMSGPDIGEQLQLLNMTDGDLEGRVPLASRMETLREVVQEL